METAAIPILVLQRLMKRRAADRHREAVREQEDRIRRRHRKNRPRAVAREAVKKPETAAAAGMKTEEKTPEAAPLGLMMEQEVQKACNQYIILDFFP